MKKSILVAILFLSGFGALHAQTRQTREEYIDRYKHIAVAHMERYGIPASITLAQGILESDCGNSALSRSSNNHFGSKPRTRIMPVSWIRSRATTRSSSTPPTTTAAGRAD